MRDTDPLEQALDQSSTLADREVLTGLSAAELEHTVSTLRRTTSTLIGALGIAAAGALWLSWGGLPTVAEPAAWWWGPLVLIVAALAGVASLAIPGALATQLALAGRTRAFWFVSSVLTWGLRVLFLATIAALVDRQWTIVALATLGLVMAERLSVSVNERLLLTALTTTAGGRRNLTSANIAQLVRYRQALGITGPASVSGLSGATLNAASVGYAVSGLGLGVIAATVPALGVVAVAIASAIEWNEVDLLRSGDDRVYVRKQLATASLIALLAAIGWAATATL